MKFGEALLYFLVKLTCHYQLTTDGWLGLSFTLFVEVYSMFFHLYGQLLDRNRAISVGVHLLEEKVDLFFVDLRMNMLDELRKLLEVELIVVFKPQTIYQSIQVNVFGVDLEP